MKIPSIYFYLAICFCSIPAYSHPTPSAEEEIEIEKMEEALKSAKQTVLRLERELDAKLKRLGKKENEQDKADRQRLVQAIYAKDYARMEKLLKGGVNDPWGVALDAAISIRNFELADRLVQQGISEPTAHYRMMIEFADKDCPYFPEKD